MPEQFRTRDCIILKRGDSFTANIDDKMFAGGWPGGQGLKYTTRGLDELLVTYSDGLYSGFALWGSNESSDQLIATTQNQLNYRYVTVGCGVWMIMTTSFEKFTWRSRVGLDPMIPIVYHASDRLLFSLNGLLTSCDEFSQSGDPRAPNSYYAGFVCQVPTGVAPIYDWMTVQISI